MIFILQACSFAFKQSPLELDAAHVIMFDHSTRFEFFIYYQQETKTFPLMFWSQSKRVSCLDHSHFSCVLRLR